MSSLVESTQGTRGKSDKPVSQPEFPVLPEVWSGIDDAIRKGDNLPDTDSKISNRTVRRALLIAGQYDNGWAGRFPSLPSTPNDIWRIYQMLRSQGYEPANIRILVAGGLDNPSGSPAQNSDPPTKKNILSGLEWLVKGAQPGDYRYFHFSGHGDAFETDVTTGKEARTITQRGVAVGEGDTELPDPSTHHLKLDPDLPSEEYTRVREQLIDRGEIKYYNEAMLAEWSNTSRWNWTEKAKLEANRVSDLELNAFFSRLPEGCTLTCTLDCCHSGRMINNAVKLRGDGFRGELYNPTVAKIDSDFPQISFEEESYALRGSSSQGVEETPGVLNYFKAGLGNWFIAPMFGMSITNGSSDGEKELMVETLPTAEKIRDKISANVMTWSSCHQRQEAKDSDVVGGVFTTMFTEAVGEAKSAGNNITVAELHEEVRIKIRKELERLAVIKPETRHLQYCQVWSSGDDSEETVRGKLNQLFVI